MMKRQPVVFNLANPHQRELYEWCMGQTTNFSGFVREAIVAYRSGRSSLAPAQVEAQSQPLKVAERNEQAIMSIF